MEEGAATSWGMDAPLFNIEHLTSQGETRYPVECKV